MNRPARRPPRRPRRSDGSTARRRAAAGLVPLLLLGLALAVPALVADAGATPGPRSTPAVRAAEADPAGTLARELAASGPDRTGFIVVLAPPSRTERLVAAVSGGRAGDVAARVADRIEASGGRVTGRLDGLLPSLLAELSPDAARALLDDEDVRWISVDAAGDLALRRTATTVSHDGDATLIWGRSLLDSRADDWPLAGAAYATVLDRTYRASTDGTGVVVHVVDTGVRADHPELTDRVLGDADLPDGLYRRTGDTVEPDADCDGHGTHVAATVAGRVTGVAPGAVVVPVKITADCADTFTASDLIAGLDWVASALAADDRPAVVNISVGLTSASSALDAAVEALIGTDAAPGTTVVVAAGNDDAAATTVSPARVADALTVGALGNSGPTFRHDQRAEYSNSGAGVDLLAPGTLVHSACVEPNRFATSGGEPTTRACTEATVGGATIDVTALTGTSMAAPHVTGVVARFLELQRGLTGTVPTPAEVRAALVEGALTGVVDTATVALDGTPDRVLNTLFLESAPTDVGMPSVLACADGTPRALVQLPTGGIGPLTWEVVAGSLPTGLTMAANGQVSGSAANAPAAVGDVTVRVTDAFGRTASRTFAASAFAVGC